MATLVGNLDAIQSRLDALARQHRVPGASLGVLDGDSFAEAVTGVANRNTGVEVTPETLFQIGSNTKIYTSTLVMQLVDEGKVDLDARVQRYVKGFTLADAEAAKKITVRMLLTHTSGIEGDYFDDFGWGDDSLERYVESLSEIGAIHPPGERWSYCNSGFCLAGRLVEIVDDKPFHQALSERILEPLKLKRTTVNPHEMLAHRYAVGHVAGPNGDEPSVPPVVLMSRSQAPAGSLTSSTAREVLRFVRMHLDEGRGRDGKRLLKADTARAMQEAQVKRPPILGREGTMGLGWILDEWDGQRVIGHGGGTVGQLSFLQVLPDRRFGICLLTNSTTGGALWNDLARWLFSELAGVEMPEPAKAPDVPPQLDLRRYRGKYVRLGVEIEVGVGDGELEATMRPTGALASLGQEQTFRLRPIDAERFTAEGQIGLFVDFDRNGRPGGLHLGRYAPRVRTKAKPKSKATAKRKAPTKRKPAAKRKPKARAKR